MTEGRTSATILRKSLPTGMHVYMPNEKEHLAALAHHKPQTQAKYYCVHAADTLPYLKWKNATELIQEIFGDKEELFSYQVLLCHAKTKEDMEINITTMTFHDFQGCH